MKLLARCGSGCALVALLACVPPLHAAFKHKVEKAEADKPPAARIAVESLGFYPPSTALLSYRLSMASLSFIGSDKLLFTFREHTLLKRIPGDSDDEPDQSIKAVVLDIASGKVLNQAQWRMHDRERYLWPLKDGHFLVRQRNSLYLTDEKLELRPYLNFQFPLVVVVVSPDRNLMVLETEKHIPVPVESGDAGPRKPPSLLDSDEKPPVQEIKRIEVMLVRPGEHQAIASLESRKAMDLPLVENGILGLATGKAPDTYVLRKQPLSEAVGKSAPTNPDPLQSIAEIRSTCQPEITSLSGQVVIAEGCSTLFGEDHAVTAYTVNGTELWRDRWQERYIWPIFDSSQDGSRFVYSSLEMNRKLNGLMDSFGIDDVRTQAVGVFDTGTGKLQLVRDANPVMSAGGNYAISADGRRFAILREGAIEIYDLPGASLPPSVPISQK